MNELPDLSRLSLCEKDELILSFWERLKKQDAEIAELKARLNMNSQNSSKPPSSDGLHKPKPKSLREKTGNKSGGQKGHPGHTLKRTDTPDVVIEHHPESCSECGKNFPEAAKEAAKLAGSRQVFDLPDTLFEVTEHQVFAATCACGKSCCGEFPADVSASVQYGARVKGIAVHLAVHHMLPLQRTAALIGDLSGLPISEATVFAAINEASKQLEPVVESIGKAIQAAPVAHADETGFRVESKLHWLHTVATPLLTWLGCHAKRGKEAFDAFEILRNFTGVLVHDGWKSYRDLGCLHALCNAHHLRELIYLFEELKEVWAGRLCELLKSACHETNEAEGVLTSRRLAEYRLAYQGILDEGFAANPRAPPSGKRGRVKQTKAFNLLCRLRDYADDVWRFASCPSVPFTNNTAEQAVRMPKVKQKISGGFRTLNGAKCFCTIRSYLATLHKQERNTYLALVEVFKGNPVQPRFE